MLAFCAATNVGGVQDMNFISLLGFVLLACLAGASIFVGSDGQKLPWFYPALPMFALLASVVWLAVIASEITALVEAIGFVCQVPRLRLGFTAIAWGNCLADLLVCLAMVRQGHAVMAITAIFAGPLVDDLIAFGLALIMVSAERGIPVICDPSDPVNCPMDFKLPLITSLFFIFISVVLLCLTLRHYSATPRLWVSIMMGWYVTFLVLVLFVQHVDAPQEVASPAKV